MNYKKAEKAKRRVWVCSECGKEKQSDKKPAICQVCFKEDTYA